MRQVKLDTKGSTVQITRAGVRLDFGGIGQGYAVDEVIKILAELRITRCIVNASGDVAALDAPPRSAREFAPSDGMEMQLAIDDTAGSRTMRVTSGDNSPPEVWELLGQLQSLLWSDAE